MSFMQLKRSRGARNPALKRRLRIIVAVIAALCIALGATTFFLVRSDRRMTEGRAQIEYGILTDLTMILRTYDKLSEPKANIGGELLPEISKHLYSAYSQDTVLAEIHGVGASILGNELYTQINAAIESMDREVKADRIINPNDNTLTPFVTQIQQILDQHLGEGEQNSMAWIRRPRM